MQGGDEPAAASTSRDAAASLPGGDGGSRRKGVWECGGLNLWAEDTGLLRVGGPWACQACAIVILRKMGDGRRHFGGAMQGVAILKCSARGRWELIKKITVVNANTWAIETMIDDWLSAHTTAWTLLQQFDLRSANGSLRFTFQHLLTKRG